jgi:hypothetical protein
MLLMSNFDVLPGIPAAVTKSGFLFLARSSLQDSGVPAKGVLATPITTAFPSSRS